ncbi:MAG: acyl carrier protein [Pirellulales bacterium]|nr:acyl carrier protein [Pirellulales bacterium]
MLEKNSVFQNAIPPRDRIAEEVTEIIAEYFHCPRDTVSESTDLYNDLGADSLDIIEITMLIEEHYDLTAPEESTDNTRTVGDVIEGVSRLLDDAQAKVP